MPTSWNVISNLLEKCDTLIIGGGMAFTFLKAQGKEVGKSLVDDTKLDYCKEMIEKAEKLGKKLLLPVDAAVAASFPNPIDAAIDVKNVSADEIPADMMGLDIGPKSAELYARGGQDRQDRCVERPPWAYLRILPWQPEPSPWQKPWLKTDAHHHHRRRRFRSSRKPAGLRRQDEPHLHRRRSLPGIPGRQRTTPA